MRYRNNLAYFVSKEFEMRENENNSKKKKEKIKKQHDSYLTDLKELKLICEEKGIDSSVKLDFFIETIEKEVELKHLNTSKLFGSTFISSIFTGFFIPIISENTKNNMQLFFLLILLLVLICIYIYIISLVVSEIKYNFSQKERYKKILKMLYDIKLLYYLGDDNNGK